MTLDVVLAHVHHALHTQARRDRGRGHAVLPSAGFRDDARFTGAFRQQRLTDGVVDLVRAGVVQVFALEKDARAAQLTAPTLSEIQRRWTTDIMRHVVIKLRLKLRVFAQARVALLQLAHRGHQGFRNKLTAVATKVAVRVRKGRKINYFGGCHKLAPITAPQRGRRVQRRLF